MNWTHRSVKIQTFEHWTVQNIKQMKPQQKYRLETVCNNYCDALIGFKARQPSPSSSAAVYTISLAVRLAWESRKENPQKLTQLSSRSHPRHLVGKRTAQKDTIIDITSDSQVNSNFPNRWSPASLTFNNYLYLFVYLYIT